ncbi:TetR family transcriptional regulator [Nocardia sp. NPDC051750]|uniref:TetR/AcrR family transcriptional regulator n=1 Tax=Nocardia sp. NPDC051750 TaxID=3364325 RepID=UPI00379D344B
MTEQQFTRARSEQAKRQRQAAILDAARNLALEQGVREITLTDIAAAVGMHKSAMLRYFETREEIFLQLTADGWREWSTAVRAGLATLEPGDADAVAGTLARTLAARGMFCDLLAQAPLNLERRVSVDAVRSFKTVTHAELDAIVTAVQRVLPGLSAAHGVDLIAAVTALAGVFWQVATPGPEIAEFYRTDPLLGHSALDVEPRLHRITAYLLRGIEASER